MAKIGCLLILLLGTLLPAIAQNTAPSKYWVQFTDKIGTPYSITFPTDFLSSRAIDRRRRYGIPIQTADLPVNPNYVAGVLALGNVRLVHRSRWLNGITIHTTDSAALDSLAKLPYVDLIEPVKRLLMNPEQRPGTPHRKERIHASKGTEEAFSYGEAQEQILMLRVDFLHASGFTGRGLQIAVIDAGFREADTLEAFEALFAENRVLGTHDFVGGSTSTVYAHSSHGTMVLSTMAAKWPEKVVGTAPDASYWLLRSEDDNSESLLEEDNWVAAAEFADSAGVDIINTSLGYSQFDNSLQDHRYSDLDGKTLRISKAQNLAAFRGILMVTSAGNEGVSSWKKITAPADADSVLAVGGVTISGSRSALASVGPTFDGRIKPDVVALSEQVVVVGSGNAMLSTVGTSFSSGLIAGASACLWQAYPQFRNMEIFEAVRLSGHQASKPNNELGYGIPNYFRAYDDLFARSLVVVDDFLRVYPNPADEQVTVAFFSAVEQEATLRVTDLRGSIVHEDEILALSGRNLYDLQWNNLPPGAYIIQLTTALSTFEKKVIRIQN